MNVLEFALLSFGHARGAQKNRRPLKFSQRLEQLEHGAWIQLGDNRAFVRTFGNQSGLRKLSDGFPDRGP